MPRILKYIMLWLALVTSTIALGQAEPESDFAQDILITGHTDHVSAIAWSPDGRTLASASSDGDVRLWDVENRSWIASLEGHSEDVTGVTWSPDSRRLASVSNDETIRIWDFESRRQIRQLPFLAGRWGSIAWSPDGKALAVAEIGWLELWDTESFEQAGGTDAVGVNCTLDCLLWSSDSRTIALADQQAITLWDIEKWQQLTKFQSSAFYIVNSLAWSPDGQTVASVSDLTQLWDLGSRRQTDSFQIEDSHQVLSLGWVAGDRILVAEFYDRELLLWDFRRKEVVAKLDGYSSEVDVVAWSPNRRAIASSDNENIRLWFFDAATSGEQP